MSRVSARQKNSSKLSNDANTNGAWKREREKASDRKQELKTLEIKKIRLDFQPPDNLIESTVEEYIRLIKRGDKLSPIRVRFDGTNYFCEDGFHRIEATRRTGRKNIAAEVFPGTLEEMEAEFQEKFLRRLKKELNRENR
jgi:hypothetical protein